MANTGELKSLTVKELFEHAYGNMEGDEILNEIQIAYDQGLRGMALRHKAEEIVAKRQLPPATTKVMSEAGAVATSGAIVGAAVAS